jgi:CHAD domain-containing protein
VAALDGRPSDQDLHQIRIKAKRLRYAAEAVSVVGGKPARRLSQAAADLQDVLGAHHDAVTAETWLREAAATLADSAGILVAGELVTVQRHQQERLRHSWHKVWTSLNVRRLRRWLK